MKSSIQLGVSILIALMVSLLMGLALYLSYLLHWASFDSRLFIIIPLLAFIFCLAVVYVTVNEFIFRKIKIIYRLIEDLRADKSEKEQQNILDAVQEKVMELMAACDASIPEPVRELDKPFLMPIEDVFTITGRGTVVTGKVEQGKVHTVMVTAACGLAAAAEILNLLALQN